MRRPSRRLAATATVVALLASAEPARAVATVDFAAPITDQASMVGLLHGLRAGSSSHSFAAALRPAIWRGIPSTVRFGPARSAGAEPMVVLSDLWGYPASGWYGRRPPYDDPVGWTEIAGVAASRAHGFPVMWDIWNEPDHERFWNGTPAQFAETFALAERALRAELGSSAFIVGPSIAHFSLPWIRDFLDRCRRLRCRIDALSWHEFPGPGQPIDSIARHLRQARQEFIGTPRYRALGIRSLLINEMVSGHDQRRPGELVAYFSALERGGADGAVRACFALAPPGDGCNDETLDGLLTYGGDVRTTPSWWVTHVYGQNVEERVRSAGESGLAVIASRCRTSSEPATVLLGGDRRAHEGRSTWTLRLDGLRSLPCVMHGRPTVVVRTIPDLGGTALSAPLPRFSTRLRIDSKGSATISLAGVGAHDAILLEIGEATRASHR